MTDNEQAITVNERMIKLVSRVTIFTAVSLAAICLVLVVCLAVVIQSTAEANDELRTELACRSVAVNDYAAVDGALSAKIAEGLVLVARGEPLDNVAGELERLANKLILATAARQESVTACKEG